jgi:DNA-binding transcriptional regulator PaaX
MPNNRHLGLLSALIRATEDGALSDLTRFTAQEIAPKLTGYLTSPHKERQLAQALWYAKKKGFLATQEKEGRLALSLTYKGKEKLLALKRLGLKFKRPEKWDGKWRMVTFDIPETRRYARDTFRQALKQIGFKKLSNSLWIYPYECRGEMEVVIDSLLIKPFVRYFLVESFEGQEEFRKSFGISSMSNGQ